MNVKIKSKQLYVNDNLSLNQHNLVDLPIFGTQNTWDTWKAQTTDEFKKYATSKGYVDSLYDDLNTTITNLSGTVAGGVVFKGTLNIAADGSVTPDLSSSRTGWMYKVKPSSENQTWMGKDWQTGDNLIIVDKDTTGAVAEANILKIENTETNFIDAISGTVNANNFVSWGVNGHTVQDSGYSPNIFSNLSVTTIGLNGSETQEQWTTKKNLVYDHFGSSDLNNVPDNTFPTSKLIRAALMFKADSYTVTDIQANMMHKFSSVPTDEGLIVTTTKNYGGTYAADYVGFTAYKIASWNATSTTTVPVSNTVIGAITAPSDVASKTYFATWKSNNELNSIVKLDNYVVSTKTGLEKITELGNEFTSGNIPESTLVKNYVDAQVDVINTTLTNKIHNNYKTFVDTHALTASDKDSTDNTLVAYTFTISDTATINNINSNSAIVTLNGLVQRLTEDYTLTITGKNIYVKFTSSAISVADVTEDATNSQNDVLGITIDYTLE